VSNVLHAAPVGDLIEHDTATNDANCICVPRTEPVPRADGSIGWLIVHHSLDGRELHEQESAQ
jgi:hypothetical protein